MTFLIGIFARWGLPESLRRPLALLTAIIAISGLCGLLWSCWLRSHDKAVIEAHETEVTAAAIEASATASVAAVERAGEVKSKVEAGNDTARKAAAKSDDPLKAGLDRLRVNPKPER